MTRTLMATASALALLVGAPTTIAQTTQSQGTQQQQQQQPATQQQRTQQNQPAVQGGSSGTGSNTTAPQTTTGTTGAAPAVQQPGQIDTQRLIGRNITNPQNETVGEIEALLVNQDGSVQAAIIGVGGFLGIGERHVAVKWDQLNVSQAGDRVTVNMSRDQVRALPEFRYSENQRRGGVFTETGPYTRPPGAAGTGAAGTGAAGTGTMSGSGDTRGTVGGTTTAPGAATAPRTGSGNMAMNAPGAAGTPVAGDQALSASNLIGLNLRNTANENIGEVKDVILGADGKVREVIVGVGGFLGMGERYVAISWDQLKMSRTNDNRFMGEVGYTRDQLRDMPVYRQDRGTWTRG